ncbi:hypothetical protein SmJEL517_g02219 [Synchytrium microbalum]|uniref:Protein-serine/threonine kinase n=1 Tax=Synchytrium microbalum TaxID=1806994 RepID=A0A507CCH3_9FUNG|nr:uncharacterized protein SmJEL517_g02219 [Synchytrium microbalum]TPX35265.1 hypothetical protein SmJEL517_g02219 [Synchytrium microbalum]
MPNRIPSWVSERIIQYAKNERPTAIKFSDMLRFGAKPRQSELLASSQFLSDEIPIRLAHRYVELGNLPYGIGELDVVKKIRNWYAESFKELVEYGEELEMKRLNPDHAGPGENTGGLLSRMFSSKSEGSLPPLSAWALANGTPVPQVKRPYFGSITEPHVLKHAHKYNEHFAMILKGIVERHNPAVLTVALAVRELRTTHPQIFEQPDALQKFLDRFHGNRIAIRILIGHHASLALQKTHLPNHVGIVSTKMDPGAVASDAAVDAAEVCEAALGVAPLVEIRCPPGGCPEMTFVPSHLHHVLFEVLKNAMRAVIEKEERRVGDGNAERSDMPPIIVTIESPTDQQVQIRISDQGIGIPAQNLSRLFTYAFTTAKPVRIDEHFSGDEVNAPLAGFGYGLPLSRLYLSYFTGNLWVVSKENEGTEVTLLLRKNFDGTEYFAH